VNIKGMSFERVVSLAFRKERNKDEVIDRWQQLLIKK
jgi:hypothetical protein